MEKYFKIGEISQLYSIGVDSLRYYEKLGIIHPLRSEHGYRLYSEKDIWRLNVILELRELGFSLAQIKQYLESHHVEATLHLLEEELTAIQIKMNALSNLKTNVEKRMQTILTAQNLPLNQIQLKSFSKRKCHKIDQGYTNEHEMDMLIKKLMNKDKNHYYVIGNNHIGSFISLHDLIEYDTLHYQSVFMMDDHGEDFLMEGDYLCVSYQGSYEQSKAWIHKLIEYAHTHHLILKEDVLEWLWIDIHTSSLIQEHITELQILVEKK